MCSAGDLAEPKSKERLMRGSIHEVRPRRAGRT
jgi:hypothetical protein